jgi:hypothetical protein
MLTLIVAGYFLVVSRVLKQFGVADARPLPDPAQPPDRADRNRVDRPT